MTHERNRALAAIFAAAALGSCSAKTADQISDGNACGISQETQPALGMMTSLPLFWPAGDVFDGLAGGEAELPWQRRAIERCYTLLPLDTVSPTGNEAGPLAELDLLAIVQPRGLSPSDNVALDDWVRGGGQLLLVLDPRLVGDYDLPLGDPGRPVDTALIPPVVGRWGFEVTFDEAQGFEMRAEPIGAGAIPVMQAGELVQTGQTEQACEIAISGVIAKCAIGAGRVTLLADATVFETDWSEEQDSFDPILNLLTFSFQND